MLEPVSNIQTVRDVDRTVGERVPRERTRKDTGAPEASNTEAGAPRYVRENIPGRSAAVIKTESFFTYLVISNCGSNLLLPNC